MFKIMKLIEFYIVYHQQLSAYSNSMATRLKAKIVSMGIATRRSGILHYCGHGRPSQLLLSFCFYFVC